MPHNSYFFVLFPVIFFLFPYLSLVQYNTSFLLLLPIHTFPPLSCLDFHFLSLLAYSIIGTPRALSSLFLQYSTTHNVRYQRRPHLTSFIEQPNRNPTTPLHPTHNPHRQSGIGEAYFQSPIPPIYHESLTLITGTHPGSPCQIPPHHTTIV